MAGAAYSAEAPSAIGQRGALRGVLSVFELLAKIAKAGFGAKVRQIRFTTRFTTRFTIRSAIPSLHSELDPQLDPPVRKM